MKRQLWLLSILFTLLLAQVAGQTPPGPVCPSGVCSSAGMSFVGSTSTCQGYSQNNSTYPLWSAGGSQSWNMWAKYKSGAVYWSYEATEVVPQIPNVDADGQCHENSNGSWTVCPGFWQPQTVWVTDASQHQYYEYYLRGYGAEVIGTSCVQTPTFSGQIYRTVGASCCQAAGGCCSNPGMCGIPGGGPTCNRTVCQCQQGQSPILIDTDGRGFHLTSATDGVVFDIKGDGKPVRIAWTAPGSTNAFLVLDRNHNGKIDNGTELFGNNTDQPSLPQPQLGDDPLGNGYTALWKLGQPEHGGNGGVVIDWHDAVYSELKLWIDKNHDGISQPEELYTLPELGVYSLGLKYHDESRQDQFGNSFRYSAVVNPDPLDGKSKDGKKSYDVFFLLDCAPSPTPITRQRLDVPEPVIRLDDLLK